MLKKYQGKKPFQADRLPVLCFCEFVAVGQPLDDSRCKVHQEKFGCDNCPECDDYRPARPKLYPSHWPICVCGHAAQGHNQLKTLDVHEA